MGKNASLVTKFHVSFCNVEWVGRRISHRALGRGRHIEAVIAPFIFVGLGLIEWMDRRRRERFA